MPTPSTKSPKTAALKSVAANSAGEWPSFVEPGKTVSEAEPPLVDEAMTAPMEKLPEPPFSLKSEVKKHPVLYIGLGALAVAGVAAFFGRGAIARTARPIVVRTVRPLLIRAAAKRPLAAAKMAARNPKAAARLVAGLR
jgi:hypothetical protein